MILLSCLFVCNQTSQGRLLSLIEWVEILLLLSYDLSPKGALFHEYHPPQHPQPKLFNLELGNHSCHLQF